MSDDNDHDHDWFDPEEGARRRDESMDQVEENAHEYWKECALYTVYVCALYYPDFTTDLLRHWIQVWFPLAWTRNKKAWGPVLTRAANAGYVEVTDRQRPSDIPTEHRRKKTVWRSLLYTPPDHPAQGGTQ